MSSLLPSSTSLPSKSNLQSLTVPLHQQHITDLLSLLITLRPLQTVPDDLHSMIESVRALDATYTKQDWDKALTNRLKSMPTLAPSTQTFFDSLPQTNNPPSTTTHPYQDYEDSKLYKSLLLQWSSSPSRSLLKEEQRKQKKRVNRRASKGRKVKYERMPKLEDFAYPIERGGGEDRWIHSMFR